MIYIYIYVYICICSIISFIILNDVNMAIVTTWMSLEDIMLSEISQTQKDKYCVMSLTCGIENSQTPRSSGVEWWFPGVWGREKWEMFVNEYIISVMQNKFWRPNVQQCDYHYQYRIVFLKFAKRVDPKCSHYKKKNERKWQLWSDRYVNSLVGVTIS